MSDERMGFLFFLKENLWFIGSYSIFAMGVILAVVYINTKD